MNACRGLEEDLWLCPIEDRRERTACRAGLLPGFSLASYLQLVDWTSRLVRQGKARVGVTAGASAPELLVQNVIHRLEQWGGEAVTSVHGAAEDISFSLPPELRGDAPVEKAS